MLWWKTWSFHSLLELKFLRSYSFWFCKMRSISAAISSIFYSLWFWALFCGLWLSCCEVGMSNYCFLPSSIARKVYSFARAADMSCCSLPKKLWGMPSGISPDMSSWACWLSVLLLPNQWSISYYTAGSSFSPGLRYTMASTCFSISPMLKFICFEGLSGKSMSVFSGSAG